MTPITMNIHLACDLFPLMDTDSLSGLVADIQANGLVNPIVLHAGAVVDGRNRMLACQRAQVEPRFVEWRELYDGPMSVTRWIWAVNAKRRHLTAEQIIAAEVALHALEEQEAARSRQAASRNMPRDERGQFQPVPPVSAEPAEAAPGETRVKLAKKIGTSRYKVHQALKIQKADPQLLKQVAHGTISLHEAEKTGRRRQPPESPGPQRQNPIRKSRTQPSPRPHPSANG